MKEEKFIAAFEELQNPHFNTTYDFSAWKSNVLNTIVRAYGQGSKQEERLNKINFKHYPSFGLNNGVRRGGGDNGEHCMKMASEFIKGLVYDIKKFGLPQIKEVEKNNNGFSINLHQNQNQNQNQNQTVNVNFIWEAIKDELTGKQVKEIDEILEGKDEPGVKKSKILDKIKSFGSDVASNIIAGIITNPALWG